jgi:hypothetical protein
MSAAASTPLDAEVVELLRESPDLLAIADAIAETQDVPRGGRAPAGVLRFAAIAAVVALAATLALVAPWEGRGSGFVGRALAALGEGQVIHVVSVREVPGRAVIDLKTGVETTYEAETEIWFDSRRGLQRTVSRINGVTVTDGLQTPAGSWTESGRVYTCAWIAAHPVEATKARVSCNAGGQNGTVPRHIPEPRPALEPSLAAFVDGYRQALVNGSAVRDGSGSIDGRAVEWLTFESRDSPPPGEPVRTKVERVAVDAQTLKPVLVQTRIDGHAADSTVIAAIETVAPSSADFSRPKAAPAKSRPVATSVTSQDVVEAPVAAAALGHRLRTAGPTLDGLWLTSMTIQRIVTGYGRDSGVKPTRSLGVEVLYGGPVDWRSGAAYVLLRESLRPEPLYGFARPGPAAPAEGSMEISHSEVLAVVPGTTRAAPTGETIWRGQLRHGGVYLGIEATSKALLLHAARSLAGEAK